MINGALLRQYVLDVKYGVANYGTSLMNRTSEQGQLHKETCMRLVCSFQGRVFPAMLGMLSTYQPFPSRSSDLAHCSKCIVRRTIYGRLLLLEIDLGSCPGHYLAL